MESVIDDDLAIWLAENGYYYVMHRFIQKSALILLKWCMIKAYLLQFLLGLKIANTILSTIWLKKKIIPEYITIDVAHGHSDYVIKMIKYIKDKLPDTFLTAGNIATLKQFVN